MFYALVSESPDSSTDVLFLVFLFLISRPLGCGWILEFMTNVDTVDVTSLSYLSVLPRGKITRDSRHNTP
jgi:hypothetical protein